MAKKGLIALFSGLGVVGILILLLIIGAIVGVIIYFKKKKEGYNLDLNDLMPQNPMDIPLYDKSSVCRKKFSVEPPVQLLQ